MVLVATEADLVATEVVLVTKMVYVANEAVLVARRWFCHDEAGFGRAEGCFRVRQ